ncbi:MAG: pilus assembly protein TadB [Acidobacteriota bacterium]|nr:pilus assembly protein TadB [Acidobacteriota bacterium]
MIALACLAFAATCVLWWPADPSVRAAAWLTGEAMTKRRVVPAGLLPSLMGAGVIAATTLVAARALVWVVPVLVAAGTLGWLISQARAERVRREAAEEVVHACQALGAQLRVGDVPARALTRVAVDSPLLQPVAATQAIGGDVPAALRAVAGRPGCHGLFDLARSWQLCQVTGAPIADAANRVADGLRVDAAAERLVAAELAGPRASGRMLAALPALGMGLGYVSGGDPIEFLGGTWVGQICLAVAVCLVCAGLVWTTLLSRVGPADEGRA